MGNHDHMLNKHQFKSAKEEGKAASEWLATDEGHQWQNKYRVGTNENQSQWIRSPSGYHSDLSGIEGMNGFFSIKDDRVNDHLSESDNPVMWPGHATARWPRPFSNFQDLDNEDAWG